MAKTKSRKRNADLDADRADDGDDDDDACDSDENDDHDADDDDNGSTYSQGAQRPLTPARTAGKKRMHASSTKRVRRTAPSSSVTPKKVYRAQALVVQHVKTLFDKQALLWKHHATAMEQAALSSSSSSCTNVATSKTTTAAAHDVARLALQPPWCDLVDNHVVMGGNVAMTTAAITATTGSSSSDAAPYAVVQKLSRDLTKVQNRKYQRQAKPGEEVYQPSSEDEDDS